MGKLFFLIIPINMHLSCYGYYDMRSCATVPLLGCYPEDFIYGWRRKCLASENHSDVRNLTNTIALHLQCGEGPSSQQATAGFVLRHHTSRSHTKSLFFLLHLHSDEPCYPKSGPWESLPLASLSWPGPGLCSTKSPDHSLHPAAQH